MTNKDLFGWSKSQQEFLYELEKTILKYPELREEVAVKKFYRKWPFSEYIDIVGKIMGSMFENLKKGNIEDVYDHLVNRAADCEQILEKMQELNSRTKNFKKEVLYLETLVSNISELESTFKTIKKICDLWLLELIILTALYTHLNFLFYIILSFIFSFFWAFPLFFIHLKNFWSKSLLISNT